MENQFQALQSWTFEVLSTIKKDIKHEHLQSDLEFYQKYFGNRPKNRLTTEEIFAAYEKELAIGNEGIAEWVVNRWVFKHGDLYQHFADRLSEINPDFNAIKTLTLEESQKVLAGTEASFGAIPTFLFSLLNGVVFPKQVLDELEKKAKLEREQREAAQEENKEQESFEKVIASQKREIARLEAKLLGVQKKYTKDTEMLKNQIKTLQKKLAC